MPDVQCERRETIGGPFSSVRVDRNKDGHRPECGHAYPKHDFRHGFWNAQAIAVSANLRVGRNDQPEACGVAAKIAQSELSPSPVVKYKLSHMVAHSNLTYNPVSRPHLDNTSNQIRTRYSSRSIPPRVAMFVKEQDAVRRSHFYCKRMCLSDQMPSATSELLGENANGPAGFYPEGLSLAKHTPPC
jgi:hypothetical protein